MSFGLVGSLTLGTVGDDGGEFEEGMVEVAFEMVGARIGEGTLRSC